jgi:hypothetical protein
MDQLRARVGLRCPHAPFLGQGSRLTVFDRGIPHPLFKVAQKLNLTSYVWRGPGRLPCFGIENLISVGGFKIYPEGRKYAIGADDGLGRSFDLELSLIWTHSSKSGVLEVRA